MTITGERTTQRLVDAFEEDHRRLTQGLEELVQALRADDLERATELAERVDRAVGAHIDFEEGVFYPQLEKTLGSKFVSRLFHEHDAGKSAIRSLLAVRERGDLDAETRGEILADLDIALEHALSCGTLLSHLDRLDEEQLATMLRQLHEARERGRRWSQLP